MSHYPAHDTCRLHPFQSWWKTRNILFLYILGIAVQAAVSGQQSCGIMTAGKGQRKRTDHCHIPAAAEKHSQHQSEVRDLQCLLNMSGDYVE